MSSRALTVTLSVVAVALTTSACATAPERSRARSAAPRAFDLVDTAAAAGNLDTLLRAADASGLLDDLRGPGPYTLFAPTDEAFDELPEGALERLLDPDNRAELRTLLRRHVVPGSLGVEEALRARSAATLNGDGIRFRLDRGVVRAGDARVLRGDIACSNGVLHVVDSVLGPQI